MKFYQVDQCFGNGFKYLRGSLFKKIKKSWKCMLT